MDSDSKNNNTMNNNTINNNINNNTETLNSILKEIPLEAISEMKIGCAQNDEAKTGVTVLLFEKGAVVGCDISGGGPASRETPLTLPVTADNPIHAIVLSGGSAFGLAAGDGVMKYLEEHNIGFNTGYAVVPLVCQSCIYDLGCGRADIRPDAAMGYAACANAGQSEIHSGSIGAGCGATVGKLCGMSRSMKSGLGVYAVSAGPLKMAAVVVVNALGDIYDPSTGRKIAGLLSEDGTGFTDSRTEMYKILQPKNMFTGNTTIGAVITNGSFSKAEMTKIASMARSAYSRCINPVGTMADGDTIYAASCGKVTADINMAGTLAAEVMEKAILNAVR